MCKNEIVYIAKPTWYTENMYPGHRQFYVKFIAQLKEYHEVRELELPDIWVRDFLPFQNVQSGELYQPYFAPRYANYTAKFTNAIWMLMRNLFPQAKLCDVRIDGGNVVISPDKKYALCLQRQTLFRQKDTDKKVYVENELKRALGVQEILWLPRQIGDKIGHIDGYLQFLGNFLMEGTLELYGGITTGSLLDYKGLEMLYNWATREDWEILHLLCKVNEKDWLDATGLYVNFLETSRAVFVPQFDLPEDDKVISTIKEYSRKPVVRVDCSKIAKYGGALHCLTREYYE
ncbi:MAG: agmatine deiminase family protein [Elusimicrobiaceae bacterium]|nr:agmatine deiminase family protein [Elusimicrobiaceae bacterium]